MATNGFLLLQSWEFVQNSPTISYVSGNKVVRAATFSYDIHLKVARPVTLSYDIIQRIFTNRPIPYDIMFRVFGSRVISWRILRFYVETLPQYNFVATSRKRLFKRGYKNNLSFTQFTRCC